MQEVAPGLRRWTTPHPDWEPSDGGVGGWEREVACLRLDAPDGVVLIDPLASDSDPGLWEALDPSGLPLTVIVTLHWHRRSAAEVARRFGARVVAIRPVAERLGEVVTDVVEDGDRVADSAVVLGPVPIDSGGAEDEGLVEEAALWLPEQRAIVVGDLLVGVDGGLRVWWSDRDDPLWERRVRPFVERLAELPTDIVLPAHGEPVRSGGSDGLREALEAPPWRRPGS